MAKTQIEAQPGVPQIVITREFDAPRDLLFRAFTDPELVAQWLGPRQYETIIDRYELRDGGRWRFLHRGADGAEEGFHGVFHGEPSPAGIVRTFEWEGLPGHVLMETATFEDRGGKTLLRTNSVFQSLADRDGMIESGMEHGVDDSMERLEAVVARLAAPVG